MIEISHTHFTLKRFMSNGELDIRAWLTAALLGRLSDNRRGSH